MEDSWVRDYYPAQASSERGDWSAFHPCAQIGEPVLDKNYPE